MVTPFQWSEKRVATKRRRRPQYEFTQPRPRQFRALSLPFESSWGFFLSRGWAVLCDNLPPCEHQILLTDHVVHRLTVDTGHWPAVRCLQEYKVSIPASDKQLIGLIGLQVASVPWIMHCLGFCSGEEWGKPRKIPATTSSSSISEFCGKESCLWSLWSLRQPRNSVTFMLKRLANAVTGTVLYLFQINSLKRKVALNCRRTRRYSKPFWTSPLKPRANFREEYKPRSLTTGIATLNTRGPTPRVSVALCHWQNTVCFKLQNFTSAETSNGS